MLTKAELLIAADAAERWPDGLSGVVWGYTKSGRASFARRIAKGHG